MDLSKLQPYVRNGGSNDSGGSQRKNRTYFGGLTDLNLANYNQPNDPGGAISVARRRPLLDLSGTVLRKEEVSQWGFEIVGTGRPGTDTARWEYRYHGYLTPHWLKPRDASGVDEHPTLVGSVFRAKPHGEGYSLAPFIPLSR